MLRRILLLGLLALTGCSAPLEKPPAAPLPISPLSAKPAPELIDSKPITAQAEPIIAEAEPIAPLAAVDQLPDQAAVIVTPAAPQLIMPLAYHSVSSQGITISAVYFDDRKFQLTVADQADGCGSQWLDAKSAALSCDGYAAINGGFFTPEGKPLGTPRSIRNQTRLLEQLLTWCRYLYLLKKQKRHRSPRTLCALKRDQQC